MEIILNFICNQTQIERYWYSWELYQVGAWANQNGHEQIILESCLF